MIAEIIYTSANRGLKAGSRGFCTVAKSARLPEELGDSLLSLSSYRHVFPPGTANAGVNPVANAHLLLQVSGKEYHVISRVCDAGLDYSHRSNKLAHHVVLSDVELPAGGPAWLMMQPGFMRSQWSGDPCILPPKSLPGGDAPSAACRNWKQVTGDAGWGGVLAESALNFDRSDTYLIFRPDMQLLPLIAESLALLPNAQRWGVTYSTYLTNLPPGIDCRWRCVLAGTPEAAAAGRIPGSLVLDLSQPLGEAPAGPLVAVARDEATRPTATPPSTTGTAGRKPQSLVGPALQSPSRKTRQKVVRPPAMPPSLPRSDVRPAKRFRGIGIALAVFLALVAVVGFGFAGWRTFEQKKTAHRESIRSNVETLSNEIRSTRNKAKDLRMELANAIATAADLKKTFSATTKYDILLGYQEEKWKVDMDAIELRINQLAPGTDAESIKAAKTSLSSVESDLKKLVDTARAIEEARVKAVEYREQVHQVRDTIETLEEQKSRSQVKQELDEFATRLAEINELLDRELSKNDGLEIAQQLSDADDQLHEAEEALQFFELNLSALITYRDALRDDDRLNNLQRVEEAWREAGWQDHCARLSGMLQPKIAAIDGAAPPDQINPGDIAIRIHGIAPPAPGGPDDTWKKPIVLATVKAPVSEVALTLRGGGNGGVGSLMLVPPDKPNQEKGDAVCWYVRTALDEGEVAKLQLAGQELVFSWNERANELSSTISQLQRCVIRISAGDEEEWLSLIATTVQSDKRLYIGILDKAWESLVEVPALSEDELRFGEITTSNKDKNVKFGPERKTADIVVDCGVERQVVCQIRLSQGAWNGETKMRGASISGRVKLRQGNEEFDPLNWIGKRMRAVNERLKLLKRDRMSANPAKGAPNTDIDNKINRLNTEIEDLNRDKSRLNEFFNSFSVDFEIQRSWQAKRRTLVPALTTKRHGG